MLCVLFRLPRTERRVGATEIFSEQSQLSGYKIIQQRQSHLNIHLRHGKRLLTSLIRFIGLVEQRSGSSEKNLQESLSWCRCRNNLPQHSLVILTRDFVQQDTSTMITAAREVRIWPRSQVQLPGRELPIFACISTKQPFTVYQFFANLQKSCCLPQFVRLCSFYG